MNELNINPSDYQKITTAPSASTYVLSEELKAALEVAIKLHQPLLLTGEPGTGKTRLAYALTEILSQKDPNFYHEPLVFNTKTTSTASDLFYTYDAIKHFHDANIKKTEGGEAPAIEKYIQLHALGKAIALTHPQEVSQPRFLKQHEVIDGQTKSSVVLIDEIDKAPRDFPNDILNEIESYSFEIKEADNYRIQRGEERGILLLMTSNSEKNLPDAFLRRCVYYHIPFPDAGQLLKIVQAQLGEGSQYASEELIQHFEEIREQVRKKKPATAELLAWLRILELQNFITNGKLDLRSLNPSQIQTLQYSYSVLAKTSEDLQLIRNRW